MKILLQIILIGIVGYVAELFLPWYSIAIVAFAFGLIIDSSSNFLGGFIGIALLWAVKIALITQHGGQDLAMKVAQIMEPVGEKWVLITVTLLVGGLVGGMACVTGGTLRKRERRRWR